MDIMQQILFCKSEVNCNGNGECSQLKLHDNSRMEIPHWAWMGNRNVKYLPSMFLNIQNLFIALVVLKSSNS